MNSTLITNKRGPRKADSELTPQELKKREQKRDYNKKQKEKNAPSQTQTIEELIQNLPEEEKNRKYRPEIVFKHTEGNDYATIPRILEILNDFFDNESMSCSSIAENGIVTVSRLISQNQGEFPSFTVEQERKKFVFFVDENDKLKEINEILIYKF